MLPRFSGPRQTCFRQVIEFPCMAWLPRNFIQSEVCIHVTCNNLIYCKSGLKLGGKTRNMFSTHFAAVPKQVAGYFCPFHRSLRLDQNRKPRMKSLRHQGYLEGDQHLRTGKCCLKRFHSDVKHLEYKWHTGKFEKHVFTCNNTAQQEITRPLNPSLTVTWMIRPENFVWNVTKKYCKINKIIKLFYCTIFHTTKGSQINDFLLRVLKREWSNLPFCR